MLDIVIMGHERLWRIYKERERLYALPAMTAEQGLKAAEIESEFALLDGYSAEAAAGELLLAVGIPEAQHRGPMSAVAPGWKLRVLLAQALFAEPEIMLLDEPTNNLDIDTIRWLEGVLNARKLHDDRHLARPPLSQQRMHAHGGPGLWRAAGISGELRRVHDRRDPGARAPVCRQRQEEGPDRRAAVFRQPLLGQRFESQTSHVARAPDREDHARGSQAVQPHEPVHSLRPGQETASAGRAG